MQQPTTPVSIRFQYASALRTALHAGSEAARGMGAVFELITLHHGTQTGVPDIMSLNIGFRRPGNENNKFDIAAQTGVWGEYESWSLESMDSFSARHQETLQSQEMKESLTEIFNHLLSCMQQNDPKATFFEKLNSGRSGSFSVEAYRIEVKSQDDGVKEGTAVLEISVPAKDSVLQPLRRSKSRLILPSVVRRKSSFFDGIPGLSRKA